MSTAIDTIDTMTSTIIPPRGSAEAVGTTTPCSRTDTGTGIVAFDGTELKVVGGLWLEGDVNYIGSHVLRMLFLFNHAIEYTL